MPPIAALLFATPARKALTGIAAILFIPLLLFAAIQTVRIEGALCRPAAGKAGESEVAACLVDGFKQDVAHLDQTIAERTGERDAERAAHNATRTSYRLAQQEALRREQEREARVAAQQQEINDEITRDYGRRLAAARAAAERVRRETVRTSKHSAGASGSEPVPGLSPAAGRADDAAGHSGLSVDERLVATEQAIQLDALISWVERQSAVDPNR